MDRPYQDYASYAHNGGHAPPPPNGMPQPNGVPQDYRYPQRAATEQGHPAYGGGRGMDDGGHGQPGIVAPREPQRYPTGPAPLPVRYSQSPYGPPQHMPQHGQQPFSQPPPQHMPHGVTHQRPYPPPGSVYRFPAPPLNQPQRPYVHPSQMVIPQRSSTLQSRPPPMYAAPYVMSPQQEEYPAHQRPSEFAPQYDQRLPPPPYPYHHNIQQPRPRMQPPHYPQQQLRPPPQPLPHSHSSQIYQPPPYPSVSPTPLSPQQRSTSAPHLARQLHQRQASHQQMGQHLHASQPALPPRQSVESLSAFPPAEPRLPQRMSRAYPPAAIFSSYSQGLTRSPPGSGDSGSSLEVTRNSSRRSSRALIDDFTYYPAILSQVAYVFRKLVPTASRYKDSLEYTDCFIGRDAVDILSTIIKSSDRNLCLLLGRALDAQGFFHDVTYNHRLRDSPNELYKFQTEQLLIADSTDEKDAGSPAKGVKDETLPNGVFTLLTHCYSPTCSADKLCYSIACPGRLEQQSRLLKQATSRSNLERSPSRTSFGDQEKQAELLWSTTVPQDIVDAVSSAERKRQEIIYEAIQTEKEFVGDLELIENVFIQPLRKKLIIPAERLESFISSVFLNISELHEINSQLLQKLLERQKANHIVDKIGDIFLATVPSFQAYVRYGAQQVFAKHILDQERATNPEFAKFLQECERDPQCRKLPIHSFLARPTTRIGRYPLFLQSAIKAAAEHHPDRTLIPQAIRVIKAVLMDINQEAGRSEDMLKLQRLQDSLIFPGEPYDLGLAKPGRAIIREGTLMLRRNGHDQEIHLYLFDHVLLMTKTKKGGSRKLYKRPIPLELIVVADTQSSVGRRGSIRFGSSKSSPAASILNGSSTQSSLQSSLPNSVHNSVHSSISSKSSHHTTITPLSDASKGFPLTITHLGRDGGTVTFHASNQAERRLWREAIESQKSLLMESKQKFEIVTLLDTLFPYHNRVNASTVLGDRLILGTDAGLYVGPLHCEDGAGEQSFKKVLDMEKISQVDVLPDHDLLTLLAEKCLWSFPLSILDSPESESGKYFHKGERVSSSTNFFKSGVCSDRTLISGVRVTALSSIVKIYEPISGESKKRGKLGKLFSSAEQTVKTFKEFYIPAEANSIHYLRTKLCVGCSKGFEIVDLDTLMPQGLIDPDDDKLDFVSKREGLKPISIFRLDGGDFLLCYDEFGFYINRFGARIKEDSLIYWLGNPTSFAFHAPYIIAFEPSFIEVRHVGTGELQQIIPTHNMRTLNTNPEILHCVMDSPLEYQCVFRLREVVSTTAAVMDELFDDEEVGDGEGEGVDDGGSVA